MPTFAGQTGQSFTHGSIQTFNKGGIEHHASTRALEQRFCLLEPTMRHLARDLHHPLFLRVLDHCSNM
jgi:hypothetical protein